MSQLKLNPVLFSVPCAYGPLLLFDLLYFFLFFSSSVQLTDFMSIYAFYENCICLLPCFISFMFMVSLICSLLHADCSIIWAAPSEFGTYRLCEQRRFRRACASAQSRQNLRCSLIHALSQEEPSDRKLDPWPL